MAFSDLAWGAASKAMDLTKEAANKAADFLGAVNKTMNLTNEATNKVADLTREGAKTHKNCITCKKYFQ